MNKADPCIPGDIPFEVLADELIRAVETSIHKLQQMDSAAPLGKSQFRLRLRPTTDWRAGPFCDTRTDKCPGTGLALLAPSKSNLHLPTASA
jgi:hypothetical protein